MGRFVLSLVLLLSSPAFAQDAPLRLQSPNGKATVELSLDAQGHPHYAVAWQGQPVLSPSPLGAVPSRRFSNGARSSCHSRSCDVDPLVCVDTQPRMICTQGQ